MFKSFVFPFSAIVAVVLVICNSTMSTQVIFKPEITAKVKRISREVIKCSYSISVGVIEIDMQAGTATPTYQLSGSCVGIGPDLVLTAAHVVRDRSPLFVDIYDKNAMLVEHIELKLLKIGKALSASDNGPDLALLKAEKPLPCYQDVNLDAPELDIGDPVYTIGAQFGLTPYTTSYGTVSHKRAKLGYWMISADVWGGNSGGGVYDVDSDTLVGIAVETSGIPPNSKGKNIYEAQGVDLGNITWIVPLPIIKTFIQNN